MTRYTLKDFDFYDVIGHALPKRGWLVYCDNCRGEDFPVLRKLPVGWGYLRARTRDGICDKLSEPSSSVSFVDVCEEILFDFMYPCVENWRPEPDDPSWDWTQSIYIVEYELDEDEDIIELYKERFATCSLREMFYDDFYN